MRVVAALLAISLSACAVTPRQHAASSDAASQATASIYRPARPSIVSTGTGVASEGATEGSPHADAPPAAGPARVIAAVLLIAILIVAIVAGAQSVGRSIAKSCCNER